MSIDILPYKAINNAHGTTFNVIVSQSAQVPIFSQKQLAELTGVTIQGLPYVLKQIKGLTVLSGRPIMYLYNPTIEQKRDRSYYQRSLDWAIDSAQYQIPLDSAGLVTQQKTAQNEPNF